MRDRPPSAPSVEALREVLEHAAALEVEGTVAAAARYLSSVLPLRRLALFELGGAAGDLREVAVWAAGALLRPRGRLALAERRLAALEEWAERVPPTAWLTASGDPWDALLEPPAPRRFAVLRVEDRACALLGCVLERAPEADLPSHAEALLPLGMVSAHRRSQRLAASLQLALDRTQKRAGGGRVRLTAEDEPIVGAEEGLAEVLHRVALVQGSSVPVLLLGETGSGKEVIARQIHAGSPRASAPFVRVNCGAIPPELIDSALFGHERGSFTGASHQHKGWFERADGGTLFLDEVGELPMAAQVRLLRVLQDGVIERVGGLDPIHVDCRIVAATHRDLPGMVEEQSFREDLWFRISAFPIEIPPLRERPQDIAPLARFFAARTARLGVAPCTPTPEDIALLAAYDWPGNVRELAMVIDRAAILGQGKRLEVAAALGGPRPGASTRAVQRKTPSVEKLDETRGPGPTSLEGAMRQHIESVLSAAQGRIEGPGGAADLLGINPHTLRSRMRKLGIDWARFRRPS